MLTSLETLAAAAASSVRVRPALEGERDAIRTLVRSERLDPRGIDWRRCLVALQGSRLVGAVQMRLHGDGARELGSLVVRREARGHRISTRLIDALLALEPCAVHVITQPRFAARFARWGFRGIAPAEAPVGVRRNYRIGRLVVAGFALLQGESPEGLVILRRPHVGAA